jgi:hypothetical protein
MHRALVRRPERVREKSILTHEQLDDILNPAALTGKGR